MKKHKRPEGFEEEFDAADSISVYDTKDGVRWELERTTEFDNGMTFEINVDLEGKLHGDVITTHNGMITNKETYNHGKLMKTKYIVDTGSDPEDFYYVTNDHK